MYLSEKDQGDSFVVELLVDKMLKGSVRALGKLITLIEDERPGSLEVLKKIYYHTKDAYVIGVTGPPGTGKSTLVDRIAVEIKRQGFNVGIIAIDPSSPFTGGAFLGDRVRMMSTSKDNDIYIRSMGTRGSLGGLSEATASTVKILDAFGKDFVLIETAGTGQAEVDVIKETDTTVVVCVPGLGDEIQTMKAGVMEIGDIFVVNKADLKDADRLSGNIETMLHMGYESKGWIPPIIKTIATKGNGIAALVEETLNHRKYLIKSGLLKSEKVTRIKQEIMEIVRNKIIDKINSSNDTNQISDELLNEIILRQKDPYTAAEEIIGNFAEVFQKSYV
ncbi:MAG: methylmalonyl Co-A mutase-associated GTPase MeaB [Deltaproteobacteria bacterium]|nr:methylmalonyl Co-A mutase-associated GTPase MeaB [Deltaproteobacteria bacterium]